MIFFTYQQTNINIYISEIMKILKVYININKNGLFIESLLQLTKFPCIALLKSKLPVEIKHIINATIVKIGKSNADLYALVNNLIITFLYACLVNTFFKILFFKNGQTTFIDGIVINKKK